MPRIAPLDPATATGTSRNLLEGVHKKLGLYPNIMKTMAQSPAALQTYLAMSQALSTASLSAQIRESVALAIAKVNGCEYCSAAHSAIGSSLGIDADELTHNLLGQAADPKTQAAITFALAVVSKQGWVDDQDLTNARNASLTEGEITEIIAIVAYNIFSNYFNHVAQTDIDFPKVNIPQPATT